MFNDLGKFDVGIGLAQDLRNCFELFSICTHCNNSTVFVSRQDRSEASRHFFASGLNLLFYKDTLNNILEILSHISIKDVSAKQPPEYLPLQIEATFKEGATCLAVGCNNAAGAMFRLCLDLATKHQLDIANPQKVPSQAKKYLLKARLDFLFQEGILPGHLSRLATCVKDNGNDGAHDGNLTREDAEDILDFTERLLDRLYSEPERIKLAEARREERRGK